MVKCSPPGLGIVAELYRCDTPPPGAGGGCYTDSPFYLQQLPPKKKIDFPYNNFPKKAISLKKCTKKKIPPKSQKKNRACGALYRCDPPGVL